SPELVRALAVHAERLSDLDRRDAALAALAEAERVCRRGLRENPACEGVWATRGEIDLRHNRYAQALVPLRRLLAWRVRHYGPDHAQTAFVRGRLGFAHSRMGEHARGIALLERANAELLGASAAPTAESLLIRQTLGEALLAGNRRERSLDVHRQCVELARRLFGARSPELALSLSQHGSVLFQEARYPEAAARYRESDAIYRELFGAQGAATAITQANHADALGELGEHARALALTREALAVYRSVFGDDSPRTGSMWSKLGDQLLDNDRVDQALEAYDRSLPVLRAQPASGSIQQAIAVARSKRALALQARGDGDQALSEARAAERELREATGGKGVYHGLAMAHLVRIACRARAADCARLREQARAALRDPGQPGGNRQRLQQALAAS